ncbi:GNAT family N-acetyltransferase [Halobaculum sp. EA56]|uniref:GNAT family N-acetyltransferase n=1 Tax=Halobaculum sp. EA56 TaxID=3421648 RepID=UPI003EBC14D0
MVDIDPDDDGYDLRVGPPTVEEFQRLRALADMAERPPEGVERGLPNSVYAVRVVDTDRDPGSVPVADASVDDGEVVGMARVVGDGGSVYHVCDMAVHPAHQRRGLGTRLMRAVDRFVDDHAPSGAYVNLMGDVDGFYERFGYEETRPASKGMYRRVE